MVKFGGIPKSVPNWFIADLRENENSDQLQEITKKRWKKGDVVAIERGPFTGYRCIFQELKGIDRVSVLLDIIGKQTRAVLHNDDLEIPQLV